MKLKRYIILASLLTIAIVLNIIESFIPMFVPGVKLGLANIVIVIMLYNFKNTETLFVVLLRIFLVGLLTGKLMQLTFFMSLSGGICSFIIMLISKKLKIFGHVGVSVLGSLAHCFGQIIMAVMILETAQVWYYFPLIVILSTLTGAFTGLVAIRFQKTGVLNQINDLKSDKSN